MRHRFPPPFAQPVREQHGGDRFPRGSLLQYVCRQRAFGYVSWHDLDRRFPVTARPERRSLTVRKLRCEFGLQMPEFGTYPLGQQFRHRRGNESFTTMTATVKTGGAHRASQTSYRNADADNPLSGADDNSGDTAAQLAVPLQLFADHNLL
jgi:hypothetical protein